MKFLSVGMVLLIGTGIGMGILSSKAGGVKGLPRTLPIGVFPLDTLPGQQDTFNARKHFSVYVFNMEHGEYEIALKYWRPLIASEPCTLRRPLVDGIRLMEYQIQKHANNPERVQSFVDTILMLIELRGKCFPHRRFGHPGVVAGWKTYYLYQYRKDSLKQIYREAQRSLSLLQERTPYFVLPIAMWSAVSLHSRRQLSSDSVIDLYLSLLEVIQANWDHSEEQTRQRYRETFSHIQKIFFRARLLKTCEEAESLLTRVLALRRDSLTYRLAYRLLDRLDCSESPLYMESARFLMDSLGDRSAGLALALALYRNGQCREAIDMALRLADSAPDTVRGQRIARLYLQAAQWEFGCFRNFSRARTLAEKALAKHPSYGEAYLFIGDLYAASSTICKENLDAKAVYWLAIDMYEKARTVDPSVAEVAQKKIARVRPHTPKKEEGFFHLLKEGDTYTVGCWIQRSTRVRYYH